MCWFGNGAETGELTGLVVRRWSKAQPDTR